MKRFINILGVAVMLFALGSVPVYALVKSDDTIVVRKGEVINDDFFAGGSEVTIEGTINGDVYVGAQRLNIRGTVNGDVIAGAQSIEVTGTIRDDLRAGGNTISLVGATIGDSVTIGGNELSIDGDSEIGGGLLFGGQMLSLSGSVGRGIMGGADTTRLDGSVGKTVRVAARMVTIDEGAIIKGDLEYQSEEDAVINGQVQGEIIRHEGDGINLNAEAFLKRFAIGFAVWAFVSTAIVGGVMLLLMPRVFRKGHDALLARLWPTVGWGALALLATIPAVILLFVSIFGIPLGILVLLLWGVAIYSAKIFTGYAAGSVLLRYFRGGGKAEYYPNSYLALLVGLVLYYGLRILPYVGMPIRFITTVVGFGMIVAAVHRHKETKKRATKTS